MATLSVATGFTIQGTFTSNPDLTTAIEALAIAVKQDYASGTGAQQGNQFFSDSRSVNGSSENLDLAGGLTDAFGTTLTFTKIRHLAFHNKSTVAAETLLISGNFVTGALLSGWVDDDVKIIVPPRGWLVLSSPEDGYTVTGTSQDIVKVDPGANNISYDLYIIGTV